jgi:IS605 OrfB family transposase
MPGLDGRPAAAEPGVAQAAQAVSWLLDADVLSQPAKASGNRVVIEWLEREQKACYTSAIVIAQVAYWVRTKEGRARKRLQEWLRRSVDALEGRILNFNAATAYVWAEPELNTEILSTKWKEHFPFSPAKNKNSEAVGLFWPRKPEEKVPWFDKGDVRGLGVDLGLTNSAAWQILQATNKKWGSNTTQAFLPELSGSRGRKATGNEPDEAERFFTTFKTKGFDITDRQPNWKTKLSFPEQNDELVWGLKRVRAQLFRLNRWAEQLGGESNAKPYRSAIDTIRNLRADDPLIELRVLASEPQTLKIRTATLAAEYLDCFKDHLPRIADRVLPWRRGHWKWKPCENDWHKMELDETKPRPEALLAGQRGVSLARLNQLKDLRQLAQSLNHLCRRKRIARGEIVPEPFEDCRQAMEDAREDRAKQIAHEIFAIALGVALAPPPEDKRQRKKSESLHGVYRCLERGPVNFIALENLTEYKTSAKQGRRENRQLTSWSHRRIHKILGELCELVGLPLVLVDPKFTSRFSAKDHSAGFRAEEVQKDDPRRSFWQRKAKEEPSGWQAEFISWLDKLPERKRLLLPKKGGEFFVSLGKDDSTYHADLNAAYRIALRALAHRDRAEISTLTKVKDKYYMADMAGVLPGSFLHEGLPFKIVFNSERLWDMVNDKLAWERCRAINKARLKKLGVSVEKSPSYLYPDEEDDVPFD